MFPRDFFLCLQSKYLQQGIKQTLLCFRYNGLSRMGGSGRGSSGGGCSGCLTRTPHATLIALIMCWAGVAVFCGTMYRGVNLSLRVLQVRITVIILM